MNGFTMLSDGYRKGVADGHIDEQTAQKVIRVYDFLATCDTDDFCKMVDSSAFNDIIRAFLRFAVENSGIDEESQDNVISQLRWIFDEYTAREVLRRYEC